MYFTSSTESRKLIGPAPRLDDAERLELAVGPGHRVRGQSEILRQASYGRQLGAGRELARGHLLPDLLAHLLVRRDGGVFVDGDRCHVEHSPARRTLVR